MPIQKWKSKWKAIKSKIWKRKKLFYSKYKQSDANWLKEVNSVCKLQSKPSSTPDVNVLNNKIYSVWEGIKQADINQFIIQTFNSVPKLFDPKPPSASFDTEFRPIGLSWIMAKVFETIILNFILKFTIEHLMKNNQYGFLPNRSTMDAIIQVVEDSSNTKEHQKSVLAIVLISQRHLI